MSALRALIWALEMMALIALVVVGGNLVLYAVGAPWWAHLVLGGLLGGVIGTRFIKWHLRHEQIRQIERVALPVEVWVDTIGDDPMDPRGDGTLRPGDPMFDNVLDPLRRGVYPNGVMVVENGGVYELHVPPKWVANQRDDHP